MHDLQYSQDSLLARIDLSLATSSASNRQFVSLRTKVHRSVLSEYPHYPEIPLPFVRMDCVYLVQMGPYFKVGYTCRPRERVSGIAGPMPIRPVPICLIRVAYAEELEYALHKKFSDKRAKAEWFCLSRSDVQYCFRLARRLPEYYPGEWIDGQIHKQDRRCKIVELIDELVPYQRR